MKIKYNISKYLFFLLRKLFENLFKKIKCSRKIFVSLELDGTSNVLFTELRFLEKQVVKT